MTTDGLSFTSATSPFSAPAQHLFVLTTRRVKSLNIEQRDHETTSQRRFQQIILQSLMNIYNKQPAKPFENITLPIHWMEWFGNLLGPAAEASAFIYPPPPRSGSAGVCKSRSRFFQLKVLDSCSYGVRDARKSGPAVRVLLHRSSAFLEFHWPS